MKLSEMKNKDAIKALCQLTPVIKKIVGDRKILKVWFRKIELKEGASQSDIKVENTKYVAEKLLDIVPLIFENHEKEVYKILSILNNKTSEEVEEQDFLQTLSQFTEVLNDPALLKLFTM